MLTKFFIAPLIYFTFLILVGMASVFTVSFVQKSMDVSPFFQTGNIDAILAILAWGSILFPIANKVIFYLDKVEVSTLRTHFRQSFFLYVLAVGADIVFLKLLYNFFSLENYDFAKHAGFSVLVLLVALLGIAVNAVMLFAQSRKSL